ncbi:MAG: insulinase family protein [Dethiobacter sp.]|nr:insulinase family protein [Dethiobacter sp.]
MTNIRRKRLKNGINLYIHPTSKFKTILVQLILHRHLKEEDVTACSLLPSVLQRGCGAFPTRQQLAYKLEELYGSELMADVAKKGERQLVSFTLDIVHDQYLPGEGDLLRKGLSILREVLTDPVLEDDGFKAEFVSQEKEQHEKVIQGLINDKHAYSVERCLQEMCSDEPFGIFKYGSLEKLKVISPASLYAFYRRFLMESPTDLHVSGDIDMEEVVSLVEEVLDFERADVMNIPATLVKKDVAEVRYISEELDVNQGKLVLGYRTGLTYADDDYFPLLVYNGILGSFPHSKLFQNVREKAGLAYYAYSRLEKHKGLLLVSAGIEVKQYEQALDIIRRQIEALAGADINDEEFNNTISGLRNQFLVEEDNPGLIINRALDGMLAGRDEDTESLLSRLDAVTRDDVARVAEQVELDTVYFLTNKGGAQQ